MQLLDAGLSRPSSNTGPIVYSMVTMESSHMVYTVKCINTLLFLDWMPFLSQTKDGDGDQYFY